MARWDYTNQTWDNIGGDHAGVNNPVHAITGDKQGNIYFGGEFTESVPGLVYPDPITLNRVARLRPGQNALEPLGDGIADGIVWFVYWDNTLNKLLLSGSFSVIGVRTVDRAVYWNGTTYEKLPLDFPGTATVTSFARHANGDYYIGFDTTGTMIIPSALNTITNSGTDESKPIFVFDSSADVIGTEYAQLTTLGNRTTMTQINFNDLFILAGSTIYVDIEAKRVYRRTGQTLQDITPGVFRRDSDVTAFALAPGVNEILVSAPDVNGTPSIDAYMLWRNKHWSLSGTAA